MTASPSATDPTPRTSSDWELFADWCLATGRDIETTSTLDLLDFARQVPAARSTLAKRLAAVAYGLGWAKQYSRADRRPFYRAPAPAWRASERLGDLSNSLRGCDPSGWPRGFRGTRDAAVLVCAAPTEQGGLGLSRTEISGLNGLRFSYRRQQIIFGTGNEATAIAVAEDPDACPACAIAEWLSVAAISENWHGGEVASYFRRSERTHCPRHAQDRPAAGPNPSPPRVSSPLAAEEWRNVHRLFQRINRRGAVDYPDLPLSCRALTEILRSRRIDGALIAAGKPIRDPYAHLDPETAALRRALDEDAAEVSERTRDLADAALEDVFSTLDEVASSADEVNARIAAILADTDAFMASLGGRA